MVTLRPFQREFEKAVANPKYDTVAISGPRNLAGNPDSPQAVVFLTSIIDVIVGS